MSPRKANKNECLEYRCDLLPPESPASFQVSRKIARVMAVTTPLTCSSPFPFCTPARWIFCGPHNKNYYCKMLLHVCSDYKYIPTSFSSSMHSQLIIIQCTPHSNNLFTIHKSLFWYIFFFVKKLNPKLFGMSSLFTLNTDLLSPIPLPISLFPFHCAEQSKGGRIMPQNNLIMQGKKGSSG